MNPELALVIAIIGCVLAVAGHFNSRYKLKELVQLKEDFTKDCGTLKDLINNECSGIKNRVQSLEIKVEPIWKVIESEALKGLRSNPDPTHVERDRLIDKYLSRERLTRDEARTLAVMLMEINEGTATGNKGLAVLGLAVLAGKYSDDIEDLLKT